MKKSQKRDTTRYKDPSQRMLQEYQGNDEAILSRYHNEREIMSALCNVSTSIGTCELVSDLFFEFILQETKLGHPGTERMRLIHNTRFNIMTLYELARAAKRLKYKNQKAS